MNRGMKWLFALLLGAAPLAHAQSCSPISGTATATVTDVLSGGNVDVSGSVTFSCSRGFLQTQFPSTFWVGVTNTNGSRTLASGANTLSYSLFTNYSGCSTAWQGATGVTVANSRTSIIYTSVSNLTVPFCFRIPSGQNTARALNYTDTETLTVRSTNSSGFSWGTGTLNLTATVNALCKFTASAGTLLLAYTSFQSTAATDTNPFTVQCTNQSSYALSLDQVSGSILGLNYSVGLNTLGTQALNSLLGTGNAQNYNFLGSVAAGQSGTCANAAGCSATDPRTITISY